MKNSFVVDLRDFAFDVLKSGVLALLFSEDETAASNRDAKTNYVRCSYEKIAKIRNSKLTSLKMDVTANVCNR